MTRLKTEPEMTYRHLTDMYKRSFQDLDQCKKIAGALKIGHLFQFV